MSTGQSWSAPERPIRRDVMQAVVHCTWSLSSLEDAMCAAVLPFSSQPNAQSLMFGSALDLRSSSVISTPVSSGRATAMCRGEMPDCYNTNFRSM